MFYPKSFFLLILGLTSILYACTGGDLEKAKKIELEKKKIPVERTLGAQMIYSDSARVKGVGYAPVLEKYTPVDGRNFEIMPKGIKIEFYDRETKIKTVITADSAIRKGFEHITTLKRNVVAKNMQGNTFNSEELIWDENTQKVYSNLTVKVTSPNGDVLYATGFNAPQDFSTYTFIKSSAEGDVKGNPLFEAPK